LLARSATIRLACKRACHPPHCDEETLRDPKPSRACRPVVLIAIVVSTALVYSRQARRAYSLIRTGHHSPPANTCRHTQAAHMYYLAMICIRCAHPGIVTTPAQLARQSPGRWRWIGPSRSAVKSLLAKRRRDPHRSALRSGTVHPSSGDAS
jgi:hypothetical protein